MKAEPSVTWDVYTERGDVHRALTFYQQALDIARELGDHQGEGDGLGNLGAAYFALGDARQAIAFYQQALDIARELGDRRGEGATLSNLGNAYLALGDARQAITLYQPALAIAREIGDRRGESDALGNLGNAYLALGDARQAVTLYQQDLSIAREIGNRQGEGNALGNLGNVHLALGDARQAITFYQQQLVIARELGDRQSEAEASWNYGLALVREAKQVQALPLLEASLAYFAAIEHPRAAAQAELIEHARQYGALPESGRRDDVLATLPHGVRAAIERGDKMAFQRAMAMLPPDQAAETAARLERAGIISGYRGPDAEEVVQSFLLLLGDIALAAHGDEIARMLAEAALPTLRQNGWQIGEATQRIWAGERDEGVLTAGLGTSDAALVKRVLSLIAGGPEMILVAGSIQLDALRHQAAVAAAQAESAGEPAQRADLAAHLERLAAQSERQPGRPWQELAAHFRALGSHLREGK